MAQKSKVVRTRLSISDTERHCYQELTLSLAQHPSESTERLLTRLIAFALEYEEGMAFGGGVSTPDDATIWHRRNDQVEHWIEVGQPDIKRVRFLAKRSGRFTLYLYGPQAQRWWQQQGSELADIDNLRVYLLEHGAIEALAATVSGALDFQVTRLGERLYLSAGETQQEMDRVCLLPAI